MLPPSSPPGLAQLPGPSHASVCDVPLAGEMLCAPAPRSACLRQLCLPQGRSDFDQLLQRNPELDFSDHPMATVTST